ncbi:N-acetylmuramic acid 6-phosphate etherase [Peribacillus alkalitolerans]|uniref:N-acetylmuramic acid 6-phosphate etherase n=1 Tax=Peribacillus alkalitolerans TaxID=1550385 RepID=UPI0013D2425F|nr:N-acetylmuramic acid 6-phosphate etherase [Peribacillus alkalitolerans]
MNLQNILTEKRNPRTLNIDTLTSLEIVSAINQEDRLVPQAVEKILPQIAQMVDHIVTSFKNGGRLIYVGAGTSGRLGVLDASECPPTFGTDPNMVIGLIAGGEKALQFALEGAEDDRDAAIHDIKNLAVTNLDVVVGIAASGRTPYTIEAMKTAKSLGAKTGAIMCSHGTEMEAAADVVMLIETGPEAVTGSTRMKAGTAQKLVLNMLTTASMIRIGKVFSNLMIDVQPTNEKLRERAKLIVAEATGVSLEVASEALSLFEDTKGAILYLLTGYEPNQIQFALSKHGGHLKDALHELKEN